MKSNRARKVELGNETTVISYTRKQEWRRRRTMWRTMSRKRRRRRLLIFLCDHERHGQICIPIRDSSSQWSVTTCSIVNWGILRSELRSTGFSLFHASKSSRVVFETSKNMNELRFHWGHYWIDWSKHHRFRRKTCERGTNIFNRKRHQIYVLGANTNEKRWELMRGKDLASFKRAST